MYKQSTATVYMHVQHHTKRQLFSNFLQLIVGDVILKVLMELLTGYETV